jgi:hypothetical protein
MNCRFAVFLLSPACLHDDVCCGPILLNKSGSKRAGWIWVGAGAGNTLKENMLRAGVNWRFGM